MRTAFLNERKAPADPSIPTAGADVGVPNQSHILDLLYAYYAFQGLAQLQPLTGGGLRRLNGQVQIRCPPGRARAG